MRGGTALALQLGHRKSIDIDLFTPKEYGTIDCHAVKGSLQELFPICDNLECLDQRQMVYTLYVGDSRESIVKLDLCYDEQPIFPLLIEDGVRLVTDREIAAMKLLAIVTGNRPKDFWDIHSLMEYYTLEDMIGWAMDRNTYTLERKEVLEAFNKVWDFPEPEDIISLKGGKWPFIADELFEMAQHLLSNSRES